MRKIAIANQKGGVGKTVTAINLSFILSERKRKVLLIDLDPQAHATIGLGLNPLKLDFTIYDVLRDEVNINKALVKVNDKLRVIGSDIILSSVETEFINKIGRENLLANRLSTLKGEWDYIIIDSPPSLGLLTLNALKACSELIIPVEPSYFALHGIGKLIEIIQIFKKELNHQIDFKFLLTMFEKRTNICTYILGELRKNYGKRLYKTVISKNITIRESIGAGVPLLEYERNCQGSLDYLKLTEEIDGQKETSSKGS